MRKLGDFKFLPVLKGSSAVFTEFEGVVAWGGGGGAGA